MSSHLLGKTILAICNCLEMSMRVGTIASQWIDYIEISEIYKLQRQLMITFLHVTLDNISVDLPRYKLINITFIIKDNKEFVNMAFASGFVLGLSLCLGIVFGQQRLTVKPHRVTEIPAAIVEYHIKDELPEDMIIGTIPTDNRLDLRYNHEVLDQLRYSFLDENPYLHLQEDTGVIRTVQMIDRDQVCSEMSSCYMQLHVLVQQIFQIITVKVEVIDINDNVPVFPVNEVSHVIAESASLGTTIKIPSAQDQDSSEYRIKWYELLPASQDAFALKSTRLLDGSTHLQLVLLKTLDPEKQDTYQLEVMASDGGDPPKSGSLIINIKINRADGNSTLPESDKNDVLEGTKTTSLLPVDLSDHDFRFEKGVL